MRKVLKPVSRSFRTRAFFLILVWILLFASALSLLSILLTTYLANPQAQSVVSLSWSGYVAASSFSIPQPEVLAISASWNIPHVNASLTDAYSSAWIGIGGQFDKSLIQLGTEHDYDFTTGQATYNAWYELLPAYAVDMPINISEGDTVTASISLINSDTNQWNIQLTDITNGQGFNQNFLYNSTRLSGEWIVERPSINNQISTLCDFGSVSFSGCQIKVNSVTASIGNFTYSKVQMINQQATYLASASALSANGSSFTVSYG